MTQLWYKEEEDKVPVLFRTEREVPKGWIRVWQHYDFATGVLSKVDPLDHDGDGEKGGEPNEGDDLERLRAAYKDKFNEEPDKRWREAKLKEKLGGDDSAT